ncbi:LamG domain-containing protein [bacterium]|nr:LamG domain-containing protein [bacterium]
MGVHYHKRPIVSSSIWQLDFGNNIGGVKNIATPTEVGTLANGAAIVNDVLVLDGVNDYLTLPSTSVLDFGTNDFTIEIWMYWDIASTFDTLMAVGDYNNTTSGFNIYANTNKVTCYRHNGTNDELIGNTGSGTLLPLQWNQVSFVKSGTNVIIDINGTSSTIATSYSNPLGNATGQQRIGANFSVGVFAFNGSIGKVTIWDKALSNAESLQNYETQKSRYV